MLVIEIKKPKKALFKLLRSLQLILVGQIIEKK